MSADRTSAPATTIGYRRTPVRYAPMPTPSEQLRADVLAAAERYAQAAWEDDRPFRPGEDRVPVAGKVVGAPELVALADAAMDGHFTEGRHADAFRERLKGITQRRTTGAVAAAPCVCRRKSAVLAPCSTCWV